MPDPDGEFALIERLLAPLAARLPGAFGLTDDAACLSPPPGETFVVTSDVMVAGVHYLPDDPADLVARKLLRVNLSDLAAMGAAAHAYMLGLALSRDAPQAWLEQFVAGLALDQATYDVDLAGGDTVSTDGPTVLSVTAFGLVPEGAALRRNAAKPGDLVFVSGTIGDAALGLKAVTGDLAGLSAHHREALVARFRLPEPRLSLGQALRGVAHAVIDISDGLVADFDHICDTSSVAGTLEAARVPFSPGARAAMQSNADLLETALTGGDDYELLFTAPAETKDRIGAISRLSGVAIACIGSIAAGSGTRVLDTSGRAMSFRRTGYQHF